MPSQTILLTGIPRSGSSLSCKILNEFPDTLALLEPINPNEYPVEKGNLQVCRQVNNFAFEARKNVLYKGTAPSKQISGVIPDNPIEPGLQKDRLRKNIVADGEVKIPKGKLSSGFLLVIKQNAFFAALLKDLKNFFSCYGLVRNPLSVLGSWSSVDLPVHDGHIPAGERFDPVLKRKLASMGDPLERQIFIIQWFFDVFDTHLSPSHIFRYEDLIESDGKIFERITGEKLPHPSALESRLSYGPAFDPEEAYRAILRHKGSLWKYYTREEIEQVYRMYRERIS